MPYAPRKPCCQPGCAALVRVSERYCTAHRRAARTQVDERRGSSAERGYGRTWRRVRLMVLADEPLCRMCKADGRLTAASEVDHIDGDSRNNQRGNLRPLCKPCHSRRTARDQGFARPGGGSKV